jgi:hypothetical protein
LAALLALQGCGSPSEPDEPAPVSTDPIYLALVEQRDALSDPGVDAERRAAEEPVFSALIDLFEANAASGAAQ